MSDAKAAYADAVRRAEAKRELPKCAVCGAAAGDACTYVTSHDGHQRGDIRHRPHFYR